MIEIRRLTKRFGAMTALDRVTATIESGAFVVLLGSNGAGKTTLLRCLAGLLAFEGAAAVGGHDVLKDGKAARRLIGYVPQRPSFPPDLTCVEALDLFARLRDLPGGDPAWLTRVGLDAQADAAVRTLSGGMRQRLALAAALQADPAVIVFDEPAAHLDPHARRALHRDLEALAKAGRTILLATHLVADPLAVASRAMVLDRGRLVYDGRPDAMGAAIQQRVIFTLNGTGPKALADLLASRPGVHVTHTDSAVVATMPAGTAFDLLAAVAASGLHPLGVHLEEPSIDVGRLAELPDTSREPRD